MLKLASGDMSNEKRITTTVVWVLFGNSREFIAYQWRGIFVIMNTQGRLPAPSISYRSQKVFSIFICKTRVVVTTNDSFEHV